jgi:hypothetical protein
MHRENMTKKGDDRKGYVQEDLLDFISYKDICPDDLHLRIRISTKLFNQVGLTVYPYTCYTLHIPGGDIILYTIILYSWSHGPLTKSEIKNWVMSSNVSESRSECGRNEV